MLFELEQGELNFTYDQASFNLYFPVRQNFRINYNDSGEWQILIDEDTDNCRRIDHLLGRGDDCLAVYVGVVEEDTAPMICVKIHDGTILSLSNQVMAFRTALADHLNKEPTVKMAVSCFSESGEIPMTTILFTVEEILNYKEQLRTFIDH